MDPIHKPMEAIEWHREYPKDKHLQALNARSSNLQPIYREWYIELANPVILREVALARTYWVSSDMANLALGARAMPDQAFMAEDLPAASGFLMFQSPVSLGEHIGVSETIDGLFWYFDALSGIVYVSHWALGPPKALGTHHVNCGGKIFGLMPFTKFTVGQPFTWKPRGDTFLEQMAAHGITESVDERCELEARARYNFVSALHTMMQQRLSSKITLSAERAVRRRLGLKPEEDSPEVTVVLLRRFAKAHGSVMEGRTAPIEFSHRWIVRGHWRNQWLSSRQCHRQQWIHAHIKGPDDKPIQAKQVLYKLSR